MRLTECQYFINDWFLSGKQNKIKYEYRLPQGALIENLSQQIAFTG